LEPIDLILSTFFTGPEPILALLCAVLSITFAEVLNQPIFTKVGEKHDGRSVKILCRTIRLYFVCYFTQTYH
jgi:hypothetical protein